MAGEELSVARVTESRGVCPRGRLAKPRLGRPVGRLFGEEKLRVANSGLRVTDGESDADSFSVLQWAGRAVVRWDDKELRVVG